MRRFSMRTGAAFPAGASLEARNKDSLQPLHLAILHDRTDTVAALLRLGANPLAACPDLYPSYARWKLQQGLQAMRVGRGCGSGSAGML